MKRAKDHLNDFKKSDMDLTVWLIRFNYEIADVNGESAIVVYFKNDNFDKTRSRIVSTDTETYSETESAEYYVYDSETDEWDMTRPFDYLYSAQNHCAAVNELHAEPRFCCDKRFIRD